MRRFFVRGVLVLFLSILPSVLGAQDARETLFWRSVVCDREAEVRVYLEVYPNGAYVEEAWACPEGQLGLDRAARILVQRGLTALDYKVGAADGLFGPTTRVALRQWQAAEEFDATGYLTRKQADALIAQGREAVAAQQKRAEEQRQRETARRQAQEAARQREAEEQQWQAAAEVARQARAAASHIR